MPSKRWAIPSCSSRWSGSWGRLLARVNDRDAAEAILEHKTTLGGFAHGVFYIQDHVEKPGRDIRTMVVGDQVVYGDLPPLQTTGSPTQPVVGRRCPATHPELIHLSLAAAQAVGGGVVTVDLLETADGQLLVNEVNHTPEFHGAAQALDADIAGQIVDYVLRIARENMIRAAIVGASGYAGGELLRLLLAHPQVEVTQITSETSVRDSMLTLSTPICVGTRTCASRALADLEKCDLLFTGAAPRACMAAHRTKLCRPG